MERRQPIIQRAIGAAVNHIDTAIDIVAVAGITAVSTNAATGHIPEAIAGVAMAAPAVSDVIRRKVFSAFVEKQTPTQ